MLICGWHCKTEPERVKRESAGRLVQDSRITRWNQIEVPDDFLCSRICRPCLVIQQEAGGPGGRRNEILSEEIFLARPFGRLPTLHPSSAFHPPPAPPLL